MCWNAELTDVDKTPSLMLSKRLQKFLLEGSLNQNLQLFFSKPHCIGQENYFKATNPCSWPCCEECCISLIITGDANRVFRNFVISLWRPGHEYQTLLPMCKCAIHSLSQELCPWSLPRLRVSSDTDAGLLFPTGAWWQSLKPRSDSTGLLPGPVPNAERGSVQGWLLWMTSTGYRSRSELGPADRR